MSKHLRAEARPADWEDLDATQKRSFIIIVKMIGEAITQKAEYARPSANVPEPFQLLDSSSTSRTVFLSGDRGTGKTTVMLSIIKATLNGAPPIPGIDDADFKDAVSRMKQSAVWLDTLDMETIPDKANLLAAILARVEDSVRRLAGGPSGLGASGEAATEVESQFFSELPAGYQRALMELQQLQRQVSMAWDSNLAAREGHVDPELFGLETSRGERARLSLRERMERALREVSTHCFKSFGLQNPLFVLPVDDIDLNPPACLHLLRLLRLISIPHLFTFILGDEKVAELVLNLKMSSELGRIAPDVRYAEQLAVPPGDVGAMAADIAVNAFRKLLPPGQRVHLSVMDRFEAFNYCPLNCGPGDERLFELMNKCPVALAQPILPDRWPGYCSLLDMLLTPGLDFPPRTPGSPAYQLSQEELAQSHYVTGTAFLEVAPRKLADFWLVLKDVADCATDPKVAADLLLARFAQLSSRSLRGNPKLPQHDRELIPMAISRTAKGEWELGRLPIRVVFTTDIRHRIDVPLEPDPRDPSLPEPSSASDPLGLVFAADRLCSFESLDPAKAATSETASKEARRRIDPQVAAELAVFHDLLAFRAPPGKFLSPLLPPQLDGRPWASAEWHYGEIGEAYVEWPAPPLRTFWSYDRFLDSWNAVLKSTSQASVGVADTLSFAWIALGTAAVDNGPALAADWKNRKLPWGDLSKRLSAAVKLAGHPHAPSGLEDWLISIALLLMPECGLAWLPGLETNLMRMAADLTTYCFRPENLRLLKRLRAMRLATLVKQNMAPLADWLRSSLGRARAQKYDLAELRHRSAPSMELIRQFAGVVSAPVPARKKNSRPTGTQPPASRKRGTLAAPKSPEPEPDPGRSVKPGGTGRKTGI